MVFLVDLVAVTHSELWISTLVDSGEYSEATTVACLGSSHHPENPQLWNLRISLAVSNSSALFNIRLVTFQVQSGELDSDIIALFRLALIKIGPKNSEVLWSSFFSYLVIYGYSVEQLFQIYKVVAFTLFDNKPRKLFYS